MPPKTNPNDFTVQLRMGIQEINENMDKKFEEQRKSTEDHISRIIKDFEVKFDGLVSKIQQDFAAEANKIKSDVNHCYEFIKQIDKSTTSRLIELEKSQNVLMRRLNRSDIIVTGLPRASPNIISSILKIAKLYDIPLNENDINQCISIKNRKEVLIKFNSIHARDSIMKKYYATRSLKLKDVLDEQQDGADIEERIYLSDHLTPMASKLCFICRKLKKNNRITDFKFYNGDVPRAVLKQIDGIEMTLDIFNVMEKYQEYCNSS